MSRECLELECLEKEVVMSCEINEDEAESLLDMLSRSAGEGHVVGSATGIYVVDINDMIVDWLASRQEPELLFHDFSSYDSYEILNCLLELARRGHDIVLEDSGKMFMKRGTSLDELRVMKDLEM